MGRDLRIKFVDTWSNFKASELYFYEYLTRTYRATVSDDPELLFYSVFGVRHRDYDCIKIHFTGENSRINFRECDFAIGMDYIPDDIRYLRVPLWFYYGHGPQLIRRRRPPHDVAKEKTRFCGMVVSNPNCRFRNEFFHRLSSYKRVDSGGRFLNNIGGPVAEKLDFLRQCKFALAFENSSYDGYTTEKLTEAMLADCIPIYWGNPVVGRDFNTRSFLSYHELGSSEALVRRIIEIDNDELSYRQMLAEPWFVGNQIPKDAEPDRIGDFLDMVVGQLGRQTPVARTGRYRLLRLRQALRGRFGAWKSRVGAIGGRSGECRKR